MATEPTRLTITICGDGGCGKSSITLRLVRSQWTSDYDPTIEDSYTVTRQIDGKPFLLSLTDTAGQEEYRGMWAGSNMASDAFLMVYDITSASSLDALSYFNDMIDIEAETRTEHNTSLLASLRRSQKAKSRPNKPDPAQIRPLPVKIIAGNKCDLQQSRQVDAKTGLDWARARGCGFMETSARNVVNIEETFALIVRRVVEARRIAAQEANQYSTPQAAPRGAPGGGLAPLRADGQVRALPPTGLDFGMVGARRDDGNYGHGVGTRRAVTAPLSPLPPGGEEKFMTLGEAQKGRWDFLRKLRCW